MAPPEQPAAIRPTPVRSPRIERWRSSSRMVWWRIYRRWCLIRNWSRKNIQLILIIVAEVGVVAWFIRAKVIPDGPFRTFAWVDAVWHAIWSWLGPSLTPPGLLILIALVAIGFQVVRDLIRPVVLIESFSVPKSFEEAGITSRVMASRIGSELERLEKSINSTVMRKDSLGFSHHEAITDIELPTTKMGVRALTEFLRSLLNLHVLRISGDVVLVLDPPASAASLQPEIPPRPTEERILVTVYGAWGRNQGLGIHRPAAKSDLDAIVKTAAEMVLQYANPYLYGRLLVDREEYENAILVARELIEAKSDELIRSSVVRDRRRLGSILWGAAFAGQANYPAAIEQYRKATELDPNDAMAHNNWGSAHFKLKEYPAATEQYRKATELDPNDATAHCNWANALAELSPPDYPAAFEHYRKATELDPSYEDAFHNWGVDLLRSGNEAEAAEKFAIARDLRAKQQE